MKNLILLFILLLLTFNTSYATHQSGDPLIFQGQEILIYGFKIPVSFHEKLEQIRNDEFGNTRFLKSSNWDGYYVNLKIENDRLYLTKILIDSDSDIYNGGRQEIDLKLFGVHEDNRPIVAEWFTGTLKDYFGKYYAKRYSQEKKQRGFHHYVFQNGILVNIEEIDVNQ